MNWILKKFDELSAHELYELLKLRSEVFVVEQNCVFLDMDDKDQQCFHLLWFEGEKLIGYTRLLPPGLAYDEFPSIGRVVNSPSVRGEGKGKVLMEESMKACVRLFGNVSIRISAQLYLKAFYESFGFIASGEPYLEDNILHIMMTKPPSKS